MSNQRNYQHQKLPFQSQRSSSHQNRPPDKNDPNTSTSQNTTGAAPRASTLPPPRDRPALNTPRIATQRPLTHLTPGPSQGRDRSLGPTALKGSTRPQTTLKPLTHIIPPSCSDCAPCPCVTLNKPSSNISYSNKSLNIRKPQNRTSSNCLECPPCPEVRPTLNSQRSNTSGPPNKVITRKSSGNTSSSILDFPPGPEPSLALIPEVCLPLNIPEILRLSTTKNIEDCPPCPQSSPSSIGASTAAGLPKKAINLKPSGLSSPPSIVSCPPCPCQKRSSNTPPSSTAYLSHRSPKIPSSSTIVNPQTKERAILQTPCLTTPRRTQSIEKQAPVFNPTATSTPRSSQIKGVKPQTPYSKMMRVVEQKSQGTTPINIMHFPDCPLYHPNYKENPDRKPPGSFASKPDTARSKWIPENTNQGGYHPKIGTAANAVGTTPGVGGPPQPVRQQFSKAFDFLELPSAAGSPLKIPPMLCFPSVPIETVTRPPSAGRDGAPTDTRDRILKLEILSIPGPHGNVGKIQQQGIPTGGQSRQELENDLINYDQTEESKQTYKEQIKHESPTQEEVRDTHRQQANEERDHKHIVKVEKDSFDEYRNSRVTEKEGEDRKYHTSVKEELQNECIAEEDQLSLINRSEEGGTCEPEDTVKQETEEERKYTGKDEDSSTEDCRFKEGEKVDVSLQDEQYMRTEQSEPRLSPPPIGDSCPLPKGSTSSKNEEEVMRATAPMPGEDSLSELSLPDMTLEDMTREKEKVDAMSESLPEMAALLQGIGGDFVPIGEVPVSDVIPAWDDTESKRQETDGGAETASRAEHESDTADRKSATVSGSIFPAGRTDEDETRGSDTADAKSAGTPISVIDRKDEAGPESGAVKSESVAASEATDGKIRDQPESKVAKKKSTDTVRGSTSKEDAVNGSDKGGPEKADKTTRQKETDDRAGKDATDEEPSCTIDEAARRKETEDRTGKDTADEKSTGTPDEDIGRKIKREKESYEEIGKGGAGKDAVDGKSAGTTDEIGSLMDLLSSVKDWTEKGVAGGKSMGTIESASEKEPIGGTDDGKTPAMIDTAAKEKEAKDEKGTADRKSTVTMDKEAAEEEISLGKDGIELGSDTVDSKPVKVEGEDSKEDGTSGGTHRGEPEKDAAVGEDETKVWTGKDMSDEKSMGTTDEDVDRKIKREKESKDEVGKDGAGKDAVDSKPTGTTDEFGSLMNLLSSVKDWTEKGVAGGKPMGTTDAASEKESIHGKCRVGTGKDTDDGKSMATVDEPAKEQEAKDEKGVDGTEDDTADRKLIVPTDKGTTEKAIGTGKDGIEQGGEVADGVPVKVVGEDSKDGTSGGTHTGEPEKDTVVGENKTKFWTGKDMSDEKSMGTIDEAAEGEETKDYVKKDTAYGELSGMTFDATRRKESTDAKGGDGTGQGAAERKSAVEINEATREKEITSSKDTDGPGTARTDSKPTTAAGGAATGTGKGRTGTDTAAQIISELLEGKVGTDTAAQIISELLEGKVGTDTAAQIISELLEGKLGTDTAAQIISDLLEGKLGADTAAQKISDLLEGKLGADEAAQKISELLEGKVGADEAAQKISELLEGKDTAAPKISELLEGQDTAAQKISELSEGKVGTDTAAQKFSEFLEGKVGTGHGSNMDDTKSVGDTDKKAPIDRKSGKNTTDWKTTDTTDADGRDTLGTVGGIHGAGPSYEKEGPAAVGGATGNDGLSADSPGRKSADRTEDTDRKKALVPAAAETGTADSERSPSVPGKGVAKGVPAATGATTKDGTALPAAVDRKRSPVAVGGEVDRRGSADGKGATTADSSKLRETRADTLTGASEGQSTSTSTANERNRGTENENEGRVAISLLLGPSVRHAASFGLSPLTALQSVLGPAPNTPSSRKKWSKQWSHNLEHPNSRSRRRSLSSAFIATPYSAVSTAVEYFTRRRHLLTIRPYIEKEEFYRWTKLSRLKTDSEESESSSEGDDS